MQGIAAGAALVLVLHTGTALLSRQNSYDLEALRGTIDTGFRPGQDDWQFPNAGSTLSSGPLGFGPGMLLTAAWYYATKPDGAAAHLYNRYDNDGVNQTAIWEDDRRALRFVSVVQNDLPTEPAVVTPEVVAAKQTPIDVWRDVAAAMLRTGEPQVLQALEVTGDNRTVVAVKHLLVYRITDTRLYVADPAYPGRERMPVELTLDGRFQPYVSKDRSNDERASQYNTMMLATFAPPVRQTIRQRWQEFRDGYRGEKEFDPYTLATVDADGVRHSLEDGETFSTPNVTIRAERGNLAYGLRVWRDGAWVNEDTDKPVTLALRPGPNVVGLEVSLPGQNRWFWHDFKYFTLVSTACDLALVPARQYCVTGEPCPSPFAVSASLPMHGLAIDWFVDDVMRRSDGPRELAFMAAEEGPHYVRAALRNRASGRVVCEAEAQVNVQPKPVEEKTAPPPKTTESKAPAAPPTEDRGNPEFWAALRSCDWIWVELFMVDANYMAVYSDGESTPVHQTSYHLGGRPWEVRPGAPPAWDGTSFSWRYSTATSAVEIRGTLSPDGWRILNLTVSETSTFQVNDPKDPVESHGTHTWRLEAKNIRLENWDRSARERGYIQAWFVEGPRVAANVVKLDDVELTKFARDPRFNKSGPTEQRTSVVDSSWTANASITVYFSAPKPPKGRRPN